MRDSMPQSTVGRCGAVQSMSRPMSSAPGCTGFERQRRIARGRDDMKITPRSLALTDLKPMEGAHFTGKAGSRELIKASKETLSAFAAVVRFETGVRNYWHAHAGGQLLHVIEAKAGSRRAAPRPSRSVRGTLWRRSRTRSTGTVPAVAGPWPTSR